MEFRPTSIPDVVLLVPKVFGDERGFFLETFRDDIERQQMALTASVMKMESGARDTAGRVDQWLKHHESMHKRWCRLINEVDSGAQGGFPLFAVAVRELVDLAESNSEV